MKLTIGIIGCGNMGEALINQKFIFSERNRKRRNYIQRKYHIPVFKDNRELIKLSDIIIIAVKPQDIDQLLEEIRDNLSERQRTKRQLLIISIAAGITTGYIEKRLRRGACVIRVMPNIAVKVGEGMSVISRGRFVKSGQLSLARRIFAAAGKTLIIDEKFLNAATAISGSGPAYFYYFIQALIKGASNLGLTQRQAQNLVEQTAKGAIDLLLKSTNLSAQTLQERVTSKKGTTEAALNIFKKRRLDKIIEQGIFAAYKRTKELCR